MISVCFLFGIPLFSVGVEQDSIVASLVTCAPGKEVYELCGHEALRVRGTVDGHRIDSIWNYGVFDFSEPHFIYRFVKGATDYRLASYPFEWFMPEYVRAGREVTEQDLNLTQAETRRLLGLLREEAKPENCRYRYNYVRDNCATRIIWRIDTAAESRIIYPDTLKYGTFRREMRAYHRNYPWYQFGIDLALGTGIDLPLRGRDEMFVPVEMKEMAAGARMADGRRLVSQTRVLSAGRPGATDGPTPWYLTPLFCFWTLFGVIAALTPLMLRRRKLFKTVFSVWYAICGLAGCLVAFLVFISEHEATSPNHLIIWLNPLQLLFAFTIWSRRLRGLNLALAFCDATAMGCLLMVWPFQTQSANAAMFPLLGTTLLLALLYIIISFRKNEKNSIIGADGFADDKHRSRGRQGGIRKAKTGGGNRR